MNSLTELNGFGATSLTVADDRPSKVIFDRIAPLGPVDQILTVTSTTVNVNAGINIVEVVNYSIANVRYQIVIRTSGSPLLSGSTITWPSLPSEVVLTVVGSTYILSGIDTPAIWEQIKNFTWNLPAGYASSPQWYLDISIIYYDSALSQDVSVDYVAYDPIYYKVSEMEITSSLTCIGQDARLMSASLTCNSVLFFEPKLLEGVIDTISGDFTIICNARLKPIDDLTTNFSLSCTPRKLFLSSSNFQATTSLNCNLTGLLLNVTARQYTANSENLLFATNTPVVDDPDPNTTATFTVTLTSDNMGYFSTSSLSNDPPLGEYTITGTRSQVNNKLAQVRFFPLKDKISLGSYTITVTKAGQQPFAKSNSLSAIPNTFTTQYITLTQTQNPWYLPSYLIYYPSSVDVLLVGGGGAGEGVNAFTGGGGGGGGGVLELFNVNLPNNFPFNIIIGKGGVTVSNTVSIFYTGIGDTYRLALSAIRNDFLIQNSVYAAQTTPIMPGDIIRLQGPNGAYGNYNSSDRVVTAITPNFYSWQGTSYARIVMDSPPDVSSGDLENVTGIVITRQDGGSTYFVNGPQGVAGFGASGGKGGTINKGGDSGRSLPSGLSNLGGLSQTRSIGGIGGWSNLGSGGSGGGGGAGGAGQNAVRLNWGGSSDPAIPGNGGQGLLSTITGLYYGAGGGGGSELLDALAIGGSSIAGNGAKKGYWKNVSSYNPNTTINPWPQFFLAATAPTAGRGAGGGGGISNSESQSAGINLFGSPGTNGSNGVVVFRANA